MQLLSASLWDTRRAKSLFPLTLLTLTVLGLLLVYRSVFRGSEAPLVVYCAHDSIYSEKILNQFEKATGIRVAPRFDTEATKSLGLVELLIREKDQPRCDVFWNNELLGTLDLHERDILHAYKGPGYSRIPDAYKDADGYWTGFGARLRVLIVNTDLASDVESHVRERLRGNLSRVAIAKPLYGTTLTHYSVLWQALGRENVQAWHADSRKRGLREVNGNATVKNLVAKGVCDFGFTDTDDYFVAKDEGYPVSMLPVRLDDGHTIAIPNTVAIINGTKRLSEAKQLVDFLLSETCEIALANSRSRQVPLGDVNEESLSAEVRQLRPLIESGYPLTSLSPARAACLQWLKTLP
jgi:iron(III) transport system substrate-binding protein